jgi:hypothetical protein
VAAAFELLARRLLGARLSTRTQASARTSHEYENVPTVPSTARRHFDDDFARARVLLDEADARTSEPLRSDLARWAVAFGVGALDAYLSDAFVDSLARAMKTCRRNDCALPAGYAKLAIPAGPLLSSYQARPNWGLRMAARAMMEKDNLLQLGRVKDLLNPDLTPGHKLWADLAPQYIALNRKRLCGVTVAEYAGYDGQRKQAARTTAAAAVLRRMGAIVQRRHDIVHNCNRPKNTPQVLKVGTAKNMLVDIRSFVTILDDHRSAHKAH